MKKKKAKKLLIKGFKAGWLTRDDFSKEEDRIPIEMTMYGILMHRFLEQAIQKP